MLEPGRGVISFALDSLFEVWLLKFHHVFLKPQSAQAILLTLLLISGESKSVLFSSSFTYIKIINKELYHIQIPLVHNLLRLLRNVFSIICSNMKFES